MDNELNRHFSGDYVQSTIKGIDDNIEATKILVDYYENLTIEDANEEDTENIGLLIGFPRPSLPSDLDEEHFLFSEEAASPEYDAGTGFGTVEDPDIGGRFSSVYYVNTNLLSLGIYKDLLEKIAWIKYNGLSLDAVDELIYIIGYDYEFSYNEWGDLVITFLETLPTNWVYILEKIFNIFCTAPQILIVNT
jgi:hypothetical protein